MTNGQNGPDGSTNRPRIGGRYDVGEILGRGGMAEVRKGTDIRLGRTVAVKLLRTDLASDATFQARFRREAQSSASLNHPAIVAVYDTGEEMSTDGTNVPQPYIVMEYVAGRTLREIIREGRKILPERALEITADVLSALDYSHRAGIVHRDIKPANVMLTPSGDVKVMDFGIARALSDASSTMTQTAAVIGTAQYLSPEQARGETVDSRSDVYSTGCLLYELLTGRPPFIGESPVSVAYQHVREPANPPSSLDDELPPEIDAIVMKALTKRVEDRYQSAAAMRADIERYLAGKPVTAPAAVPLEEATSVLATVRPGEPDTGVTSVFREAPLEPAEEPRNRLPLIILIIAILALLAAAAFFGPKLFDSPPKKNSVPSLRMMTAKQAEARLVDAGLTLGTVDKQASEDVKRGRVVSQSPVDGELIPPGDPVDIVISTGKPNVVVPDVLNRTKEEAEQLLQEQGLKVQLKEKESDEEAGTVVDTKPRPATKVTKGTLVKVYYASGPKEVPNVVGMKEKAARAALEDAGFDVSVNQDTTTRAKKGTVLKQIPEGMSTASKSTTVVITVSDYTKPEETPTPSPTPSDIPSDVPSDVPSGPPSELPSAPPSEGSTP